MRFGLFQVGGGEAQAGLLTKHGVVSLGDVLPRGAAPQRTMERLIDEFATLRPELERLAVSGEALPLDSVRLLPPLPRPGKILCSTAGYGGQREAEPAPLLMTLKSGDAVIGPGQVIELPETDEPWMFTPDVELGIVIVGPARRVSQDDWRSAVFGYTCVIDVMARLAEDPFGEVRFGRDLWLAKSDTLCPLGPWIVTADEIADPNDLRVRSWTNGEPRQDYNTASAEYRVPRLIELATSVMTLYSGDLIACGSSRAGLAPIQDGDTVEAEIGGVGRLAVGVSDPLKRRWERGLISASQERT